MMTVIETIPITEPVWFKVVFPIIIATLMGLLALMLVTFRSTRVIGVVVLIVTLIFACSAVVEYCDKDRHIPTGEYYVRATFTDDFPFLSVMGTYDIVMQDGDEFVLKPK